MNDTSARFEHLLHENRRILFSVCHSFGRTPEDREDLAQEIAIQLWRAFPTYDGRAKFSTWMYRVALNAAIDLQRKEKTRTRHLVPPGERLLETAAAPEPAQDDQRTLLYRHIHQLDPLNRSLLLLYIEGNSYEEISAILGISEANIASRISRLKQSMRKELR